MESYKSSRQQKEEIVKRKMFSTLAMCEMVVQEKFQEYEVEWRSQRLTEEHPFLGISHDRKRRENGR